MSGDASLPVAERSYELWQSLRARTPARIGLGRTGDTLPLGPVLDLQRAHAEARDAVHAVLDVQAMRAAVAPHPAIAVASAAADRATYLRRPDLGRSLAAESRAALGTVAAAKERVDLVFVVADGLSATAVANHAAPLLSLCLPRFAHLTLAPIVVATQARVALGDAIGAALGARLCIVLIGERPGLSVADSLGVYMTYEPRIGRRDSERNCISNIHGAGGLRPVEAADILSRLIERALAARLTGVGLKEGGPPAILDRTI